MPLELDLGPAARAFRDELRQWLEAKAMLMPDQDPGDYQPDKWQTSWLANRSHTIWGGTAQVQRNIVGERVLGLPKEPV